MSNNFLYKLKCDTADDIGKCLECVTKWVDGVSIALTKIDGDIHVRFEIPRHDAQISWNVKTVEVKDEYYNGGMYRGLRIAVCGHMPHYHDLQHTLCISGMLSQEFADSLKVVVMKLSVPNLAHEIPNSGPLVDANIINRLLVDVYKRYREQVIAIENLMLLPDRVREYRMINRERELASGLKE